MGQRWPIVCLHLEPVMIFAVPMILQFVIEETQDFMGKCLLMICSLFLRRGNMYDYFRIYLLVEMQNGRDNFTVKVEIE